MNVKLNGGVCRYLGTYHYDGDEFDVSDTYLANNGSRLVAQFEPPPPPDIDPRPIQKKKKSKKTEQKKETSE